MRRNSEEDGFKLSTQSHNACASYEAVLVNHVSSCSYPLIKWTIPLYDETCMRVTGSVILAFKHVFLMAFRMLEMSIGMVCDHLPKLGCELNNRLIKQT